MTLTLTLTTDPLTLTRYLWDGTLHSLSSQDAEWIHHSIRVFEGDFTDPRVRCGSNTQDKTTNPHASKAWPTRATVLPTTS